MTLHWCSGAGYRVIAYLLVERNPHTSGVRGFCDDCGVTAEVKQNRQFVYPTHSREAFPASHADKLQYCSVSKTHSEG
jgi:hypothetical protein